MALYSALSFIRDKVKIFLQDLNVGTVLDIINKEEEDQKGVHVSLLFFEEEKTMKNNRYLMPQFDEKSQIDSFQKVNPTIFLNLYVMISSNHQQYDEALKQISRIIEGFQQKNVFVKKTKKGNKKGSGEEGDIEDKKYPNLDKLILEMQTLSFEQNNSLWQTIGSKLYPYIIYKVKTVAYSQTDGNKIPRIDEEHLVFEVKTKPYAHAKGKTEEYSTPNLSKDNNPNGEYVKEEPDHEHLLSQTKEGFLFVDETLVTSKDKEANKP